MRGNSERLRDILDAIAQIEQYAEQGQETFARSELIQVWIVHHLVIIGEATRAISASLKAQYSEVPWQRIADLRNLLIHEYFRIDLAIVWGIVEQDLSELKSKVEEILGNLGESE